MSNHFAWRMALALIVVGFSNSLHARVAPADFSTLVRRADVVVLGKVISVETINGVKIARVKVLETYKGRKLDVLSFVAQPTWTCDISDAVKGETALLLLHSYKNPRKTSEQASFSPRSSPEELEARGAVKPILLLMDSGRGRMPVRTIAGQQYVTLWVDDLRLPASVRTVVGPRPKSSYIRSVRFSDIVELMGTSMALAAHSDRQH
jgi:hypothetical protein